MQEPCTNIEMKSDPKNRIWQILEGICLYASIGTILFLLLIQIPLSCSGIEFSDSVGALMVILLSAAVGFLTNFIAIEMLFKPYEKNRWHYLSLFTLGFWQQGLVPSKKGEIAVELGKQVETRLLNPEKIAEDFCSLASNVLDDPNFLDRIEKGIQTAVLENEDQITEFLYPQIESSLISFIDEFLTSENVEIFLKEKVDPYLRREDVRKSIAQIITQFCRDRSEEIILFIKDQVYRFVYDYLSRNPLTVVFAAKISDGLINAVQWDQLEWRIYDKLNDEKTQNFIRGEILNFLNNLRDQFGTEEMREKIGKCVDFIKIELKGKLKEYLHSFLPKVVHKTIASEILWNWLKETFLPGAKPKIESWVRENGKDLIIEKLNIAQRVQEAVDRQDLREFHGMINSVAKEHLGAIQVLGYLLGGIIGILQLFAGH
ncbi:MAG: DUF445 family protein [Planctomycetia bacterium]|nr:DUF445 family protein [Planctomycetia bacterium]